MVFGFCEGKEDPSFYRSFVDSVLPDDWTCKLIQSGNKKAVIDLYKFMDWSRFRRESICFFVDRDLADFLSEPAVVGTNLFISDHYSIENEIVTFLTVQRIFEEIFRADPFRPEELEKLESLFNSNLSFFKESLACIMAQIVIWRRAEARGRTMEARLSYIKMKKLFGFRIGVIHLDELYSKCSDRVAYAASATGAPLASEVEIASVETEFRSGSGVEKFVRGKYMFFFLVECSEALRQAIPHLFPQYSKPPGINPGLGTSNAMMLIGPRARCPVTLRDFLKVNYSNYISEFERAA
jgi:hypothetical protein